MKMVQNGRISDFHGLLTLTLTLDPGMVITFFSYLIEYYLYTKFHRNLRNFLWADGRTDGRKFATHSIRSTSKVLEVDLKMEEFLTFKSSWP